MSNWNKYILPSSSQNQTSSLLRFMLLFSLLHYNLAIFSFCCGVRTVNTKTYDSLIKNIIKVETIIFSLLLTFFKTSLAMVNSPMSLLKNSFRFWIFLFVFYLDYSIQKVFVTKWSNSSRDQTNKLSFIINKYLIIPKIYNTFL